MGHRSKHAPKHGSLAYLPRGRASSHIGKINYWPKVEGDSPMLLSFAGYKAGMSYVYLVSDHRGSPTFGQEVFTPITVIETPPMLACGVKAYIQTGKGMKTFSEVWMKKTSKDLKKLVSIPESFETDKKLEELEKDLEKIHHFHLIFCTQPRLAAVPQKKPDIMETRIGGGTIKDQFDFAKKILGKQIRVSDSFKEGQFVDVIAVTKGKGWQGPVKRWGIKRKQHKSNKTVREVACIGPWNPAYVMYSVPRAGQTGFHHRTERNKRILKIGVNGDGASPKGGFPHYGVVQSDFVLLSGSVPGSAKRLIKLRYATRPPTYVPESATQITMMGITA